MKLFDVIFNFILPRKCMFCTGEMPLVSNEAYCRECFEELPFKEEKRCLLCGRQIDGAGNIKLCKVCSTHKMYFDANYSPFNYSGKVEEAIKRFKFADKSWYGVHFAKFIYDELKDKNINCDYIVYPPVNYKTFLKRGYNQAEILSVKLSGMLNIPCIKDAIYKTKDNEKQSLQSYETRFSNVRGIFEFNKKLSEKIDGKNILLVDDILTTGATISECAKTLKKNGARSVVSATVATTK